MNRLMKRRNKQTSGLIILQITSVSSVIIEVLGRYKVEIIIL